LSSSDVSISVAVEADGPIPLVHSLSSLGAAVAGRFDGRAFTRADPPLETFYAELQPIEQAAAVAGVDREALDRSGEEPAMTRFAAWVPHTHNARDDAVEQADLFANLFEWRNF
jgi:hypothetical protein